MNYDAIRLDRERGLRGWTQLKVARATGLSPSVVGKVFRGLPVHPQTLKKVADALDVPMEEVLLQSSDRSKSPIRSGLETKLAV